MSHTHKYEYVHDLPNTVDFWKGLRMEVRNDLIFNLQVTARQLNSVVIDQNVKGNKSEKRVLEDE